MTRLFIFTILSKSSTKCLDITSFMDTRKEQPIKHLLNQYRLRIVLEIKLHYIKLKENF